MAQNSNPFDPESMAIEYEVGGKKLKLLPLRVKAFRRLVSVIEGASKDVNSMDPKAGASQVVEMLLGKAVEMFTIVFHEGGINQEFVDEHMTVSQVRRVIEDVVRMNGLEQWFPALSSLAAPPATPGA